MCSCNSVSLLSKNKLHFQKGFLLSQCICDLCSWVFPLHSRSQKHKKIFIAGLSNPLHPCIWDARKWRENEKMKRKWREIHSLHFLIFSLFPPPPVSISYIKNCLILSRNVKYGPFVANVIKNLASILNENEIIQALELFTPLLYMKRKRLLLLCQNSMLSLYFLKDHSWSLP